MAGFELQLKRIRTARSLKVRILSDGRVLVTAPYGVSRDYINDFLANHQDWITRQHQQTMAQLQSLPSRRERLLFRGKAYHFRLNVSRTRQSRLKFEGDNIVVTAMGEAHSEVRQVIEKAYRRLASQRFEQRVPLLGDLVGKNIRQVTIRSQRSRWGSCSSQQTISLNWRLIMAPDWVSDYVIYHELAHLTWMNHSHSFWQLLSGYYPKYRQAEKWLKDHHNLLHF